MSASAEVILEPGEILYREGDMNDCAYIVESGEIILFSDVAGKRVNCERRGAGSIVGELSILTMKPRAVSVEALTPCRLFRISADQIVSRFDKLDPVLRACVETSITFTNTLKDRAHANTDYVPFAPSTLRNADELIETLQLENDITKGLGAGEFWLAYQPIVQLSDSSIVGVEALMRWQHPTRGFVPPFKFIEIAEAMDSIGRITDFALSEACAGLKRMRASMDVPGDFYTSVNISGKDIGRAGFVDLVAHALDKNDLDPQMLKLELTETALVDDPENAALELEMLRALGCGISIDDFGTGYSNLAYLKKLPLTVLKIDRAFAGDAHQNAVSCSIVRMLLGLAEDMGVDVVAEGLETADDVATLSGLGCHYAQGYHFHKPMPEADLIDVIGGADAAHQQVA